MLVFSSFANQETATSFWASFGDLGVEIFFVISGYVISRGLLKELRSGQGVSLRSFYIRRCVRIFPPLYLYISTILLLKFMTVLPDQSSNIKYGYLFLCNLPAEILSCGGYSGLHLYTLSFEEQFYFIFPIAFFICSSVRALPLLSLLCFGVPALAVVALILKSSYLSYYLSCVSFLAVGVCAAFNEAKIVGIISRLKAIHFVFTVAIVVVLSARYSDLVGEIVYKLTMPSLIVLMLFSTVRNPFAMRLLTSPFFLMIGRSSYSIYLWQQLATHHFEGLSPYWSIVFVILAVVWGVVSFRHLESPLIHWVKQVLLKPPSNVLKHAC
ncbi:MAG: acyltransferase [Methylocystaceae bacterium]|nr:acyltransferase [Methylocystaceae bacterium]